jgi:hypothetical protein
MPKTLGSIPSTTKKKSSLTTFVNSTLRRLRQKVQKFKASWGYIVKLSQKEGKEGGGKEERKQGHKITHYDQVESIPKCKNYCQHKITILL